jgi:ketosteroid isomerase-like protein
MKIIDRAKLRRDMSAFDPVSVTKQFIDALFALDIDALGRSVSEDFVIELPAAPSMMRKVIAGREEFLGYFGGAAAAWTSFGLTHCELHASADDPHRVYVECESEGVNVDGSPYRNTYIARAIVLDGVVTRYREMNDPQPLIDSVSRLQGASAQR